VCEEVDYAQNNYWPKVQVVEISRMWLKRTAGETMRSIPTLIPDSDSG
jgi:hypothetical protein